MRLDIDERVSDDLRCHSWRRSATWAIKAKNAAALGPGSLPGKPRGWV